MMRRSAFRLLLSERILFAFLVCLSSSSWIERTEGQCVPCDCDACCFEVVEEELSGLLVGNLLEISSIYSFCLNSSSGCEDFILVDNAGLFNVNQMSGEVTTSKPIDRESDVGNDNCIRSTVDVTHPGGDVSFRTIFTVYVIDINDNAPEFQLQSLGDNTTQLTGDVQERGPQAEDDDDLYCSSHLVAKDDDLGNNAIINYTVVDPNNGMFSVQDEVTQVCLKNLGEIDFETQQFIVIVVQAEDNGVEPLSSNVSVNLTIQDRNDNSPVFQNTSTVLLNVSESQPVGSEIATFVADDADSGKFGTVTYSIREDTPGSLMDLPFELNDTTGVLYLSKGPDADSTDPGTMCNFEFDIDAVDGGGNKAIPPLEVCVVLINENDHPPEFVLTPTSLVYLTEGPQDNSTSLAQYLLRDPDPGQVVTPFWDQEEYFRVDMGAVDLFTVFHLYVNVPSIDRETTPSINMTITFKDNGTPPRSEMVNVTVIIFDVNDNDPGLTRANFSLVENSISGIPVVELTAYFTDPDCGANGSFGNAILISDTHNLFDIQDQRVVTQGEVADREKDGNEVVIVVELYDGGTPPRSANQTLYITILDENDNSPVFQEIDESTLFVTENDPSLQNITIIEALDDDLGENGTVLYSLNNTDLTLFHIDPVTGQLSAMGDFDRETQEHYMITVVATDQGVNATSSSVDLTITVEDTNDWSPAFEPGNFSFSVETSQPPDTFIGSVPATDRDSGSNAEINYSLSGNRSELFSINASGGIFTSPSFKDVTPARVELSVFANNTYQENMSDAIAVTISVISNEEIDNTLTYIVLGAALLVFLVLLIAALIVLIVIVYYCRTHTKKRTLNHTSSNHVLPRRSSLRPTPSAGKDSTTINSINGAGTFSRSPTVNFRPDSEVAYYNREQAIAKSEFEMHTVPVQHNEEKGSDKDNDCTQIPTKESPSQAKHIVPNPRLSDDLSSSSTTSNPPEYSPFYSQHTSQHSTVHQTMVLSEDALKEHNRVYSEGGGMLSDSTARYLATVEEPMDRDDGSTYTDGGIHSVIRSYYPSHRSNQSISVPVSQYVSQNGTLPSADSSPNLHYVPTHGASSIPGVYYSNVREPISNHRRMMVMSNDALNDHLITASRYEPPIVTSSSRLLMPESNGMAAVRSIEHYPSSSPETQAEEELVHVTPLPPTHYPLHYPIPHRTRSRDHLPPVQTRVNGSISHMELVPHPSRLNIPRGPYRQRSYQHHPSIHSHPLPPPAHPMPERGPPPYASYHSFAASEDNSTMASSVLDQYLVFDHEPAVRQYDLTLSVDDIGPSSNDPESKRPPL